MKVFYICDPDKNNECRKRNCGKNRNYGCRCTSNPDYAKTDGNGKPIVSFIHFDDAPPILVNGGVDG